MSSVKLENTFRSIIVYAVLASVYLTLETSYNEFQLVHEENSWKSILIRNIATTCEYAAVPVALLLLTEASKYKIMQNSGNIFGFDGQLVSVLAIITVVCFNATWASTTKPLIEQLLVILFSAITYLKCFDFGPLTIISHSLRKTAVTTFIFNNLMNIFLDIITILSTYLLSYLSTFSTTAFLLATSLSLTSYRQQSLLLNLSISIVGAVLINPSILASLSVNGLQQILQRIGQLGRQLHIVIYPTERTVYQPIDQVLRRSFLVIQEKSSFLISRVLSAVSSQHASSTTASQAPAIQMTMTRRGKKSAAVITPDSVDDFFVVFMIAVFITTSIIVITSIIAKRMPLKTNIWSRLVAVARHTLSAILMGLVFDGSECIGLLTLFALQPLIAEAILLSCQSVVSQSQSNNAFYDTTAIALDISNNNQEDQSLQVHQHAHHKGRSFFWRSWPLVGLQVFIAWKVLLLTINRLQSIVVHTECS